HAQRPDYRGRHATAGRGQIPAAFVGRRVHQRGPWRRRAGGGGSGGHAMNLKRIGALALRYTFLYTRSVPRVAEMFFWPVMDLLVWGMITVYLRPLESKVPATVTFFLGAMIFWDILYRAQQAVTISFLEDIWARNLLNI